eukprot:CAMPEP_0181212908 /NCGR_PEP_ID=MMETSP1096-20121128/24615_1 /TAXON_ID=156174 ORGANISM="Chrysochromulina ericina, Strain CCMP281" /NCGR_SAMPLE_ID=MMETSP1096 /ASSEMBLY_ACC=CAM_ASM_000453 /LENGTH=239 /DNA_ID=CAMNT_0023304497 /DNA_START=33 /DNA_END=752 /DNA_ORIENTATION=-
MYAAVPPIYGGPPAEAPVAAAAAPTGPPLSAAQQRLAALKSKLSEARGKNHKEVVEEDRRNKIGPEALQKERAQANYEKQKKAGLLPSEMDKMMGATAEATEERLKKEDKKEKHRVQYGWDVFNNEAQHRNYKKRVRRGGEEGKLDTGGGEAEVVDEDPDPLAYGEAPPVPRERVQALVEDMHEAALRRTKWSRRRTFHEERDVTYINKRNEVYNKKIERAFDPYTAEIKANLERGTAL